MIESKVTQTVICKYCRKGFPEFTSHECVGLENLLFSDEAVKSYIEELIDTLESLISIKTECGYDTSCDRARINQLQNNGY